MRAHDGRRRAHRRGSARAGGHRGRHRAERGTVGRGRGEGAPAPAGGGAPGTMEMGGPPRGGPPFASGGGHGRWGRGGGAGGAGARGRLPRVPARQPCAPSGRWVARRDRRRPRGAPGTPSGRAPGGGATCVGGTPTVMGGRVCGCIAGGGPAPGIIGRGTFWAAGPGAPACGGGPAGFEGGREGGGRASGGGPRWIAIATEDRSGSRARAERVAIFARRPAAA